MNGKTLHVNTSQEQPLQCLCHVNPEATGHHRPSSTVDHLRTAASGRSGQKLGFALATGPAPPEEHIINPPGAGRYGPGGLGLLPHGG